MKTIKVLTCLILLGLATWAVIFLYPLEEQANACRLGNPGFFLCEDGNCNDFSYEAGDTITEFDEGVTVVQDSDSAILLYASFDWVMQNLDAEASCKSKRPSYTGKPYDPSNKPVCSDEAIGETGLLVGVAAGSLFAACVVFTGGACAIPFLGVGVAGYALTTGVVVGLAGKTVAEVGAKVLDVCINKPRSITLQAK